MIQSWLKHTLAIHYPGVNADVLVPPDHKMGDYSTNIAFILAKQRGTSPVNLGHEIVAKLRGDKSISLMFGKLEVVAPGFINFTLKPDYIRKQLANVHNQGHAYGRSTLGKGKKVIVEYSSPNIAKPMHIGNIRSAIIGDALANIYNFIGYKVIRWNYLGDWGTQFGKLIAAYKKWGNKKEVERDPIPTLLKLYVRFHEEIKTNLELEQDGQEEFHKLETGNKENQKLLKWFRAESLKGFNRLYDILGIKFNVINGESDFEKDLQPLVDYLLQEKIAERSEGAIIIKLEQFNLPPMMIQKSDGSSVYHTREIVSLQKRLDGYDPVKIMYVVANQQSLHFQQLFVVAQLLGLTTSELVHVKFGFVLGADGQKMATREGKIISAEEVIAKVTRLAREVVEKKNSSLSEKEKDRIAEAVGIGALKYNDLMEHRNSDVVFDWNRMLSFSGNSGPYLQYTYARLASIRRKSGRSFFRRFLTPNLNLLETEQELRLMRYLLDFPETIRRSADQYVTNNIALYLYELANLANRFYESVRILDDKNTKRRDARIFLIEAVIGVLRNGLGLLGIKTLERI